MGCVSILTRGTPGGWRYVSVHLHRDLITDFSPCSLPLCGCANNFLIGDTFEFKVQEGEVQGSATSAASAWLLLLLVF